MIQTFLFRKLLKTLAHPPFTAPEQTQARADFSKREEKKPFVSAASDRGGTQRGVPTTDLGKWPPALVSSEGSGLL